MSTSLILEILTTKGDIMKVYDLTPNSYWRYVDELEGRGLDLSYPEEAIKAIKRLCLSNKILNTQSEDMVLFINNPQDGIPYETKLTPNAAKAIRQDVKFKSPTINSNGDEIQYVPSTRTLINILRDQDKYFCMCMELRNKLPQIVHNIKIGNYRYASIIIATLVNMYNIEIVRLINDYFSTHKFFDKQASRWYSYIIVNNKSYIISNEPYIAVLIYRYQIDYDKPAEHADLIYENYDVLTEPDREHTIKRGSSKSFLQDCKKVALVKKELTFTTIGIIEFHDLIKYGGYNDKILSIENVNTISEIFGHKKWLHQFFVALGLYCDNYIKLDDLKEDLKSKDKSLIDPNRLKDFDLFLKVVEYLDSIYDSITIKQD